jgi:hypothetical protein
MWLAGETEVLGENLPGANPGRRGGKPATNRFSYGAAPFGCCSEMKHMADIFSVIAFTQYTQSQEPG